MHEYEEAIENAARDLYAVFWAEVTPELKPDWHLVQENQRRGWRAVATEMANAVSNYVLVYGYNGKRDYQGLDALIATPDHK